MSSAETTVHFSLSPLLPLTASSTWPTSPITRLIIILFLHYFITLSGRAFSLWWREKHDLIVQIYCDFRRCTGLGVVLNMSTYEGNTTNLNAPPSQKLHLLLQPNLQGLTRAAYLPLTSLADVIVSICAYACKSTPQGNYSDESWVYRERYEAAKHNE